MKKGKLQRFIYLDHAAATPLDSDVKKAIEPYWADDFANPSAIHAGGMRVRRAIEGARKCVAGILQCTPQEVVFIPGGTAGNNLAILGIARMAKSLRGAKRQSKLFISHKHNEKIATLPVITRDDNFLGHIVVSAIEHESVLEPARQLEKEGFAVSYVEPDRSGIVQPEAIKKALRPETFLVSIMYANNEIGTIQPIREIAKLIHSFRRQSSVVGRQLPFFHTDACQAANYLDLNVQRLGVDLMTLNGSKVYGPKMTGVLYIRKGIELTPVVYGGGQEHGLWSGTENVPSVVGFAKALEITQGMRDKESKRLTVLRDYFIEKLRKEIPSITLNGDPVRRLPNNVHISLGGLEGEALVVYLDARGIAAAVGSACTSQSTEPSHVLKAIGLSPKYARSSIRFTLGRKTMKGDCDYTISALQGIIRLLSAA